jgi:hypothetical protein
MGLGESSIAYWDDMKKKFLAKYQPYCKSKDSKEDIFKMSQREDESLEEYLERFLYNVQKCKQTNLPLDVIHIIFLKGALNEYLDALNLMGARDVSQLAFPKVVGLCKKYSRGKAKTSRGQREILAKATKSASSGVTRSELGQLFEDFKTDLMNSLGSQLDT